MGAYRLTPPRAESTVRVSDKRVLGIAEFGPPDGRAIFWLHGTPGARRQVPPAARDVCEELGVRLIGVERPGTGRSTRFLYRHVRDFADDLGALADELDI